VQEIVRTVKALPDPKLLAERALDMVNILIVPAFCACIKFPDYAVSLGLAVTAAMLFPPVPAWYSHLENV
jgi:hypothetical protein